MPRRVIRNKLPCCIFENFEIDQAKRGQLQFSKITRVIYSKIFLNQTCYLSHQTNKNFVLKTISFNNGKYKTAGNYKITLLTT